MTKKVESIKKEKIDTVKQEPSKVIEKEAHSVIKCARCASPDTSHQMPSKKYPEGKPRWFSQALGGFSKNPHTEPVLCEHCQRQDRLELQQIIADEEKHLLADTTK